MKTLTGSTAILTILLSTPVHADPTWMLGLAVNFGGGSKPQLGITGKILSSDQPDEFVGAAGVTYFFDGKWGVDAGIGYTFDHGAVTLGYDFVNRSPQFAAGWADIDSVC